LNITSKNIDKIIKDLEFALGSDSEKEEIKANEKL
jgi:hypothetical protein